MDIREDTLQHVGGEWQGKEGQPPWKPSKQGGRGCTWPLSGQGVCQPGKPHHEDRMSESLEALPPRGNFKRWGEGQLGRKSSGIVQEGLENVLEQAGERELGEVRPSSPSCSLRLAEKLGGGGGLP